MKIIDKIIQRHAVYCPHCHQELLIDGVSSGIHMLYCQNKDCFRYYQRNTKTKELKELASYQDYLDNLHSRGLSGGPGNPTGYSYSPKLIRMIWDKLNK